MKAENVPAFPFAGIAVKEGERLPTLRDWFAGQALAGFAASPSALGKWHDGTVAKCAYEIADALLAQREEKL